VSDRFGRQGQLMASRDQVTLEGVLAAFDEHLRALRRTHGVPGDTAHYARFVRAFLQSGTDLAVIAVAPTSSPAVTHQYLEADLAAKEAVLQQLADPSPIPTRFHPGDRLLAFLQDL
jgi:hypothetical protein